MGKKKSYHHGNLRAALLLARLQVLAEGGVDALSLRKVTQLVGVSHAAVYRHFDSKEALLAALAQEGFERLHLAMTEAMQGKTLLSQFTACGVCYITFATTNPEAFRIMFGHAVIHKENYPELMRAFDKTLEPLIECIDACQRAGVVCDGPTRQLAMLAWSAVHGQAALLVDHQLSMLLKEHESIEQLATQLTMSLYRGFAPD